MNQQLTPWAEQNPALVQRGIDEYTWNALCTTIYPGARPESVIMAIDYCKARKLDIMLKPVHLVPMQVKDAQTNQKNWRDVPMPGIGLYRIQADRSGNYAGADEPEFGPVVEGVFQDAYDASKKVTVRYPEWCKYTVYKLIGGERVAYRAMEYWLENYATQKAASDCPNAMWQKRPYAQLAKCTEAQSLRKGWPEIGAEPTAEEMEGKTFLQEERDITPASTGRPALTHYPDADFELNFPKWRDAIESGKQTPERIISMVGSKAALTEAQQKQIMEVAQ